MRAQNQMPFTQEQLQQAYNMLCNEVQFKAILAEATQAAEAQDNDRVKELKLTIWNQINEKAQQQQLFRINEAYERMARVRTAETQWLTEQQQNEQQEISHLDEPQQHLEISNINKIDD